MPLRRIAAPYSRALRTPDMRTLCLAVLLGFTAWSAASSYAAVWLATQLHLTSGQLATTFACTGIAGAAGSLVGGHAVARYGARRVMMAGSIGQSVVSLALFNSREPTVIAIGGLVVLTLLQPLRGVSQRATLSAITTKDEREFAFVAFRSAMNLGVLAGPALVSALLLAGWAAAHAAIIAMFVAAFATAAVVADNRTATGPASQADPAAERLSLARIARDLRLVTLVLVTTGAWTLVSGIEIVLPAIATEHRQIPVPAWGLLYAAATVVIVLVQLPVGQRLSRISIAPRLLVGAGALAVALIPEIGIPGLAAVGFALAMLVVGEVVWGPPSEEIVVAAVRPSRRVEYLSVTGMSIWFGESCAGLIGFAVAGHADLTSAWLSFLAVGAVTAVIYYLIAIRVKSAGSAETSAATLTPPATPG